MSTTSRRWPRHVFIPVLAGLIGAFLAIEGADRWSHSAAWQSQLSMATSAEFADLLGSAASTRGEETRVAEAVWHRRREVREAAGQAISRQIQAATKLAGPARQRCLARWIAALQSAARRSGDDVACPPEAALLVGELLLAVGRESAASQSTADSPQTLDRLAELVRFSARAAEPAPARDGTLAAARDRGSPRQSAIGRNRSEEHQRPGSGRRLAAADPHAGPSPGGDLPLAVQSAVDSPGSREGSESIPRRIGPQPSEEPQRIAVDVKPTPHVLRGEESAPASQVMQAAQLATGDAASAADGATAAATAPAVPPPLAADQTADWPLIELWRRYATAAPAARQAIEVELRRRGFSTADQEIGTRLAGVDGPQRRELVGRLVRELGGDARRWLLALSAESDVELRYEAAVWMATSRDLELRRRVAELAAAESDPRFKRLADRLSPR